MPLDDIASALGLDFEDLLNDLDAIVYSGTKLNIDYFLEDVMDEDQIDDIYEYFRESDTDDIDTALDELGDYEENEMTVHLLCWCSWSGGALVSSAPNIFNSAPIVSVQLRQLHPLKRQLHPSFYSVGAVETTAPPD